MMTSRKFPDVIEANWLAYTGGPAKAIKDKSILRLNELIDQHAPNFKKLLADHPEWRKMIVNDEGDIYCFPFIRGDNSLMVFQGPIVRKDWLDKLGMPMPETIDDWYAMLQAFRDKDPNGNGKKDEVPFTTMLYGLPLDSFKNGPSAFIGAWDTTWGFYQDGGKVKYSPLVPQYKDFLTVMAKWYKEGLIDPDTPTMDQKLEDAKVTGNILGSFVQNTGGGIGKFMGLMAGKDDKFKLVAAPYPVLKKGDKPKWGQRDQPYHGSACAAITTAAKNVPEIRQVAGLRLRSRRPHAVQLRRRRPELQHGRRFPAVHRPGHEEPATACRWRSRWRSISAPTSPARSFRTRVTSRSTPTCPSSRIRSRCGGSRPARRCCLPSPRRRRRARRTPPS